MKPKLIIWDRRTGKTTRILETVKWLKALVICPTKIYANKLNLLTLNDRAYKNVIYTTHTEISKKFADYEEFDIVCIDELDLCFYESILSSGILRLSKIQPVITTSLDKYFEVEE